MVFSEMAYCLATHKEMLVFWFSSCAYSTRNNLCNLSPTIWDKRTHSCLRKKKTRINNNIHIHIRKSRNYIDRHNCSTHLGDYEIKFCSLKRRELKRAFSMRGTSRSISFIHNSFVRSFVRSFIHWVFTDFPFISLEDNVLTLSLISHLIS